MRGFYAGFVGLRVYGVLGSRDFGFRLSGRGRCEKREGAGVGERRVRGRALNEMAGCSQLECPVLTCG